MLLALLILVPVALLLAAGFRLVRLVYVNQYKPRYDNHWAMTLHENVDPHAPQLGKYYGDFTRGLLEKKHALDANGVFAFTKSVGLFYNPTGVAEYAIVCYDKLQDDPADVALQKKFSQQIDWLKQNFTWYNDTSGAWEYTFDWYGEQAPWTSGIAQGIGISAMLRAYQLFDDQECLRIAERAFNFMNLPSTQGGHLFTKPPFEFWYDETSRRHVINGHVYALLGVWDLYRVTQKEIYKLSFERGCACLKKVTGQFDLGFYTRYDDRDAYPAPNSYHTILLNEFKILFAMTGDVFFQRYAQKFAAQFYKRRFRFLNFCYLVWLTLRNRFFAKPDKQKG